MPYAAGLIAARETARSDIKSHLQGRYDASDRGLRHLRRRRKERGEQESRGEGGQAGRFDRDGPDRRSKIRRASNKREPDEGRPLAVGAHGLAHQDGCRATRTGWSLARGSSCLLLIQLQMLLQLPRPQYRNPPPSATGTAPPESALSPMLSDVSHQPAPAPLVPQYQTFGPDPLTFDDPTIYHIRAVAPTMSENEVKGVYSVVRVPCKRSPPPHPRHATGQRLQQCQTCESGQRNVICQLCGTIRAAFDRGRCGFLEGTGES